jgi:hypothetical protein
MARQAGPIYLTGTLDDITYYKMDGQYLARKKSSLTRKQFRTDPRFARSRNSAAQFGQASQLASRIYRLLPKEAKGKGAFGKLTRQVGRLLHEGKSMEEVIQHFQQHYQPEVTTPVAQTQAKDTATVLTPTSFWKVTPGGKLIGPKPNQAFHTKAKSPFSAVLNSSSTQLRE